MTTPHHTPLSGPRYIKAWLERKYGAGAMHDIVDEISKTQRQKKSLDYMRFKELSELVEATRLQAMMDMWNVRRWRQEKKEKGENQCSRVRIADPVVDILNIENHMMERRASESWNIYRKANHLFHKLYKRELARCREPSDDDFGSV